jgi:SPP1 family predicted phage head-tail adaptor
MIGKLDRRITIIQAITETGDSNEDKITGWEEIELNPNLWAQKIERNGNTLVQSDRVSFSQQTNWVIRFRDDLNVRMRLVYDGQMYEILNISERKGDRLRYTDLETQFLDNEYYS